MSGKGKAPGASTLGASLGAASAVTLGAGLSTGAALASSSGSSTAIGRCGVWVPEASISTGFFLHATGPPKAKATAARP